MVNKFIIAIILFFYMIDCSFSQTVDSIKIEQEGNLVKIQYGILNSNPYQTFRVTIYSTINGGLRSELRSLSGDFGDKVMGGRPYYLVIWDVLKDVEEVHSFDITVKAELIKNQTPESMKNKPVIWAEKRFFIVPAFHEGHGVFPGLRLAYAGKWGVSALYTAGNYHDHSLGLTPAFHSSLSLLKRIINYEGFQLHFMAGISYAKESYGPEGDTQDYGNFFGGEYGALIGIRRFVITLAGEYFDPSLENNLQISQKAYANFGFGIRF
jgi:hypothetical protein